MRHHAYLALATVLAVVGVSLLTYPRAASWLSAYNQVQVTGAYSVQVSQARPQANIQLEAARAYNQALRSGAQLAENERLPLSAGDSGQGVSVGGRTWTYRELLTTDPSGLMARLRIPAIGVDLPIYHGTSDATLLKGVGHLHGTSLPIGGVDTRTVLTAHRGLANATMFTNLVDLEDGDLFTIEVFGQTLTYQVFDTKVVAPDESEELLPQVGRDLATLVTCTPLGINSHRILVTGERVLPIPQEVLDLDPTDPDIPGFPYWLIPWAATIIAALSYLTYLIVALTRRRKKSAGEA